MPCPASRPCRRRPTLAATATAMLASALLASAILGCGMGGPGPHIAIGRKVAPLEIVPLVDLGSLVDAGLPKEAEATFPKDADAGLSGEAGTGSSRKADAGFSGKAGAGPPLEGKVTLLNFWGTWCPPCRRELPGMARLATRLADEPRFQLVAVSCGTGPRDDLDVIRGETLSFLRERKLDLVAWADPDGRTRFQFAATMEFSAYPTTYLIGPDATVRKVWVGYRSRDEADIAAAVVALLRSAERGLY